MMHVFQIQLPEHIVQAVNSGQSDDPEIHAWWMAYLECTVHGNVDQAVQNGMFSHVADIAATSLDEAFHIGNMGPEEKITRFDRMSSLSVGNILQDKSGSWFVCLPVGWQALDGSVGEKLLGARVG